MITENTKTKPAVQYDERILNFLDYIILLLSQANTVEEIDLIMDDFLSNDIVEILSENSELFSALPVVWLETFERVCMQKGETSFSLKTLYLPIMFKKLGWKIEDSEKLDRIHHFARKNVDQATILHPSLVLLFIEGLFLSPQTALSNFKENTERLNKTAEDEENINSILNDIKSLGW